MRYRKALDYLVKEGHLTEEDVAEVESEVAEWQKVARSVFDNISTVAAPITALGFAFPAMAQMYNSMTAGRRQEKAFESLLGEYPELGRLRYGERNKPIPIEDVRKAFDVGYHLAPYVMQNPTLAKQITMQVAESQGVGQELMKNLVQTELGATSVKREAPGAAVSRMLFGAGKALDAIAPQENALGDDEGNVVVD